MKKHPLIAAFIAIVILLPSLSFARIQLTLDDAFPGFSSNEVGDIGVMYLPNGDTVIWVGTGKGISKTTDRGENWYFYDQRNGLNQNEISALTVSGTTLWAAPSYNKDVQGTSYPYGRGFNKTSDLGDTWESFLPFQVSRYAGMVCYDIAIEDTTVWAAAWYGGLIRTQDGGETWENVFVDSAAQADFEEEQFDDYRNYFFAVTVDTVCPIEKKLKNSINDILYDGQIIWVATQNGLNGSLDLGSSWFPKDTSSGLNSNAVYCLAGDTSSFWAGLYEEQETIPLPFLPSLTGAGFNYSDNLGFTWNATQPDQGQASSYRKFPLKMALADTVVWAACGQGGLIRSFDGGVSWENVFADTSARRRFEEDQLEAYDVFTSVAVDTSFPDTTIIWGGTLDGICKFVFTESELPDTAIWYLRHSEGEPYPIGGYTVVLSIGVQHYNSATTLWIGGYWHEGEGGPWLPDVRKYDAAFKSTNQGETWETYLDHLQIPTDFAFLDSAVWIATDGGLKRTTDGGENWDSFEIVDSTSGELIIPSQFTSVCVVDYVTGPVVFVGSIDGLAKSADDGVTWEVIKFADSFRKAVWAGTAAGIFKFIYNYRDVHDAAVQYSYYQVGITGNWVVALALQQLDGRKILWAGTQPAYDGEYGASFSMDDGDTWQTTLVGDQVWNFDFDDTVIWAATSSGLKRSKDWGENWDVFNYLSDKDPITKNQLSSTEFTSVKIIDNEVWAGNVDGLVRSQDGGDSWDVFRTAVHIGEPGSETAYAYPSPFSPILQGGQITRIHYRPKESGAVTVKIYDFAMDLVVTLVDGEARNGEVEYDEPWDGRNQKGDFVANGVYFFKVEAAGGQTEWGKVVILK
jgi:photosystem II stability/assembly factor-like uncharacterized protein